jgi:PTH1 family peptidyl-tRNA hydrolase
MPLNLLVGLGNPGAQYVATRHNVGAWFIEKVALHYGAVWRQENKFAGRVCQIQLDHLSCWLLQPTTFMNHSGQSVATLAHFYKIPPESILIAHDELSFPAGVIRFKEGGGHAGHNGLRDIITRLKSSEFKRLRILGEFYKNGLK